MRKCVLPHVALTYHVQVCKAWALAVLWHINELTRAQSQCSALCRHGGDDVYLRQCLLRRLDGHDHLRRAHDRGVTQVTLRPCCNSQLCTVHTHA